ncbi:unnamed protein product [Darwinula stevensoni]|uniref:GAF domain-containing protein n=1 Tax=Darwinula stevensoni TaxID=69355 RepID=A0A7R8XA46_9CRUS|nr:unnamed protein product [Darwinula stevensoni]CAG0886387.1 unnamed protein product [Darwinula stevensoni]
MTAIANARVLEASRREYERNRQLVEVIHDIFEEQRSLDSVVLRILQRTQRLLLVERAAVSLLEENTLECRFGEIFEMSSDQDASKTERSNHDSVKEYLSKLAHRVAFSGQILNLDPSSSEDLPKNFHSVLAMPIRNVKMEIMGVATIVNKRGGEPFDKQDERWFEVMAYHSTSSTSEVEKLMVSTFF